MNLLIILADNDTGRADDGTVVRNINHIQKTIGADTDIIPDSQRAKNSRPGADKNIIADSRMPFAFMFPGPTQRDIMKQNAIITDFGRFANHNAGAMVDK